MDGSVAGVERAIERVRYEPPRRGEVRSNTGGDERWARLPAEPTQDEAHPKTGAYRRIGEPHLWRTGPPEFHCRRMLRYRCMDRGRRHESRRGGDRRLPREPKHRSGGCGTRRNRATTRHVLPPRRGSRTRRCLERSRHGVRNPRGCRARLPAQPGRSEEGGQSRLEAVPEVRA